MLPELEREDFIATRQEEVTSRRMRQDVAQMAARSAGAAAGPNKKKRMAVATSDGDDDDDDDYGTGESMSRSTRSRKTTGSSKTKSEGIEKLKQSRAAKGKKKQAKVRLRFDIFWAGGLSLTDDLSLADAPQASDSDSDYDDAPKKSRRRAASDYSGSDMDQSSDDGRPKKGRSTKSGPPIASYDELRGCQATRSHLADMCRAPFFDEWVQGALPGSVRPLHGNRSNSRSDRAADVWVRCPVEDVPGQQERKYRLYQVTGKSMDARATVCPCRIR